jgi:hypothetical protein
VGGNYYYGDAAGRGDLEADCMTAEEIRIVSRGYAYPPDISVQPPTDSMLVVMLGEIAAQMAELNQHLAQVDEVVFGTGKPQKWSQTIP